MPITSAGNKTARRLRFRYTIRSLLVLTAIIALWLGHVTNRARRQREAVAALVEVGAEVRYDWQSFQNRDEGPSGPRWLRELIGDEYFQDVVSVRYHGVPETVSDVESAGTRPPDDPFALDPGERRRDPSEEELKWLSALPKLRSLDLDQCGRLPAGFWKSVPNLTSFNVYGDSDNLLSDTDLEGIGALRRLEHLAIIGSSISDSSLAEIARLKTLEYLCVMSQEGTDEGIAQLGQLPRLRTLRLSGTQVKGPGLANLESLEDLNLDGTAIDDAGMAYLRPLRQLSRLDLSHTAVTGRGLRELRHLPNLSILRLSGPAITDLAMCELEGLSNLDRLELGSVKVSGQGIAELGRLPKLSHLRLFNEDINDEDLRQFEKLKSVQSLELLCPLVTRTGLLHLKKMPKLRSVMFFAGGAWSVDERKQTEQAMAPIPIAWDHPN
ncbi:MAG: hypothetical protein NTW96_03015 [Planctomycetia bacterium]|nr:hypothetical protein [Planctomycetia bacterium]